MLMKGIIAGIYGVSQPYYFFLTKQYWSGDDCMIGSVANVHFRTPIEAAGKPIAMINASINNFQYSFSNLVALFSFHLLP